MTDITFTLTKDFLQKQALAMQAFIKLEHGEKLKLQNAYNCIAKMYGFESWNHLSPIIKQTEADLCITDA